MPFDARMFNSSVAFIRRKGLTPDPFWAAGLALPNYPENRLEREVLHAIGWSHETGRMPTHLSVALFRLTGAGWASLIGAVAAKAKAERNESVAFLKEAANEELRRLGGTKVLREWNLRECKARRAAG